jgi:hypothetical protein
MHPTYRQIAERYKMEVVISNWEKYVQQLRIKCYIVIYNPLPNQKLFSFNIKKMISTVILIIVQKERLYDSTLKMYKFILNKTTNLLSKVYWELRTVNILWYKWEKKLFSASSNDTFPFS